MPDLDRIRADNRKLHGYVIHDSSNVRFVGWQDGNLLVWYRSGGFYRYENVSVQRAVACALAPSVGRYLNQRIKPNFNMVKIA